jgi:hypothetical protein
MKPVPTAVGVMRTGGRAGQITIHVSRITSLFPKTRAAPFWIGNPLNRG